MNTPEQFALAALVAAGHVSQTTVDKALALYPGAALTQGAGAVEPVGYIGACRLHSLADQRAVLVAITPSPQHKDDVALHTAQHLQQAVARAVEECAVICEGMHEEDRPGDYAAAIRAKGTQ